MKGFEPHLTGVHNKATMHLPKISGVWASLNFSKFILLFIAFFQTAPGVTEDWGVLETHHFEIIHEKKDRHLAHYYSRRAERAYELLSEYFTERPSKTLIVLKDRTDLANGFATFFPYSYIQLYPVLPRNLSSVGDYGDWALELMIHEYTHTLSMYPSHGFYTPLRWIFGSLVRPNGVLPRWWLEGLAVEMESRLSRKGRLRSPQSSATLRALIQDQQLKNESIDRVNESGIPSPPFGRRPYLLGGVLWHEAFKKAKDPLLADRLIQRHSRRFPFLLNQPLRDEINISWPELLDETYAKLNKRFLEQKNLIENSGSEDLKPLFEGQRSFSIPRLSPDGLSLALVQVSNSGHSRALLIRRKNTEAEFSFNQAEFLFLTKGTTNISWQTDSQSFVLDRLNRVDRDGLFRDLYEYNLNTKNLERLTQGARAESPKLTTDGKSILFVRRENGKQRIAEWSRSTGKFKDLYRAPIHLRISNPETLNSRKIVFLGSSRSAEQRLYAFDRKTRKIKKFLKNFPRALNLKVIDQKIFLISDESGVPNVYEADSTGIRALTNTLTQVRDFEVDLKNQSLITVRETASTLKLYRSNLGENYQLTKVGPLQELDLPEAPSTRVPKVKTLEERNYSSLPYLLPKYWIPFIYPIESGLLFQGSTTNYDPLQRNQYTLSGATDTLTKKPSYGLSWLNRSFPLDISLSHYLSNEYFPPTKQTLTQTGSSLGVGGYILGLSNRWTWSLTGLDLETERQELRFKRRGVGLGFGYSNFGDPARESRPQLSFSTGAQTFFKASENHIELDKYRAQFVFQTPGFWPDGSSLKWQIRGSALSAPSSIGRGDFLTTLGERNIGGNFLVNLVQSSFLTRGYPTATFAGEKAFNVNFDYSFSLFDIQRGFGTFPLFLKNVSVSLFADAMAIDGIYISSRTKSYQLTELDRVFWSTGADIQFLSTTAYHIPLSLNLGLYYGLDEEAGGGFLPFIALGFGGIQGLGEKAIH